MAVAQDVWEVAKNLYSDGIKPRAISDILAQKKVKVHYVTISKKAAKEGWRVDPSKSTEQKVDKIIAQVEKSKEFKAVEAKILDCAHKKINLMQSLNDIFAKALDLKNEILDRTKNDLQEGVITPLTAAKTLNNLGLAVSNIAKMAGIKIDDDNASRDVSNSGDDDQVKIYLPANNRDLNKKTGEVRDVTS